MIVDNSQTDALDTQDLSSVDTSGQDTNTDPEPIELSDDSYVRVPGVEKPVKFGEHYRGLQSQFTKTAQEAARLRAEHSQAQALLAEREKRIADYERRFNGGQPRQANPYEELTNKLKALPYLKGEEAAEVVQQIVGGFGHVANELQRRDLALGLMYKKIQELEQGVSSYTGQQAEVQFDGKIAGFVQQVGLPKEAADFAKKLYLAYEGDDLDAEFPAILKQEWDSMLNLVEAQRKARIEAARRAPFVPTRGGNGRPSAPLAARLANASPAQTADALWEMVQAGGE